MVRRGEVFGMNTTVMLLLVLVAAIGFTAFLTTSSGGMQSLLKGVCEKNPQLAFCNPEEAPGTFDSEVARKSTEALVCAVNSVGAGSEWSGDRSIECSDYQNTPGRPVSAEDYLTLTREIGKKDDCVKACMDDQADLCKGLADCKVTGGAYLQRDWLGLDSLSRDKCECTLTTSSRPYFGCNSASGTFECTISNFRLPQEATAANEWIPYFGDPKFLVYWQSFPMSEDTWTFHDAGWMYAATIAASAIPLGGAGKVLVGAGLKTAGAIAKTAFSDIKSSVFKYEAKQIERTTLKAETAAISKKVRADLKTVVLKDVKDKAFGLLGRPGSIFRQGGKLVLGAGVVTTLSFYDVVDSWLSKMEVRKNMMVLKRAGVVDPGTYLVEKRLPVILSYKSGMLSKSTPTFVLASPCYISEMKVSKIEGVVCGNFGYDGTTGYISCTDPDTNQGILSKGYPRKGDGYPSCYEPDNYIRTRFQADNWDTGKEDPVNSYVLGFRNTMPGYVEMTSSVVTSVVSDKAVLKFNKDVIASLAGAELQFDTDGGLKSLPFAGTGEKENDDGDLAYSGIARYCGITVDAYFDKPSGSCDITEGGFAKAQQVSATLWDSLLNKPFAGTGFALRELEGVGCYAYLEISGDLGKEEKVDDPAILDGLKATSGLYEEKPFIEYEEDDFSDKRNVLYRYSGSSWEWRFAGPIGDLLLDGALFSPVSALSPDYLKEHGIATVNADITKELVGKDYAGGIDVFKDVLSKDTDSSGDDDTSDDYVDITYDTVNDGVCGVMDSMDKRRKIGLRYGSQWSISSVPSSLPGTESDYWIELFDNNGDTFVDMVGINNGYGSVREQYIAFTESESGNMDSYIMSHCSIPESILVGNVDKMNDYENNYCFAQPTKTEMALSIGSTAVIAAGTIAAGFVADGAAIGLLVASGAASGTMDVIGEHSSKWPNSGG
ncbi:MAG: hypothetical protein V1813_03575 [Candidatus Aenigmatarchaeota archaeon]